MCLEEQKVTEFDFVLLWWYGIIAVCIAFILGTIVFDEVEDDDEDEEST